MKTPVCFIALFHRRWAVPALAELHRGGGAKFVTLSRRLGASPSAVRLTMDHLVERGWARRNEGYGHPLRPEYLLTPRGEAMGPACVSLVRALDDASGMAIGLRKWSMPVLHAIGSGPTRFGEIASRVGVATDRAIALTLSDLQDAALVGRELIDGRPPFPAYGARRLGRELVPILEQIVRLDA